MKPLHHALISVKKHGGVVEDYMPIHNWFDKSKSGFADVRHRAARHHSEGIYWCEEHFGDILVNSDGKKISVRTIAEQHVIDDLGWIPSLKDWLQNLQLEPWMRKANKRALKEISLED